MIFQIHIKYIIPYVSGLPLHIFMRVKKDPKKKKAEHKISKLKPKKVNVTQWGIHHIIKLLLS